MANVLPYLEVKGTHYQVGFQVGENFQTPIHKFLDEYESLKKDILPFIKTDYGGEIYHEFLHACKETYPDYMRELQGMADGARAPFTSIFACNIFTELMTFSSSHVESMGCTDIHVNNADTLVIAHNEDFPDIFPLQLRVIISVTIYSDDDTVHEVRAPIEQFTTFGIAGFMFGIAPSFNTSGLVFSGNVLHPGKAVRRKFPRLFIYRSLLQAKTFQEVIDVIKTQGKELCYGLSLNLGTVNHMSRPVTWNVELLYPETENSLTRVSVHEINQSDSANGDPPSYIHCNRYFRFQVEENHRDGHVISSGYRQERYKHFKAIQSIDDVLEFLGDQEDDKHPVFRTWRRTDPSNNAGVILFDLLRARMEVYIGNPKDKANLQYSIDIPRA